MNASIPVTVTAAAAAPVTARTSAISRIRVWCLPTRVFHWATVGCVAGVWLTAETERWRDVHVMLGYTLAGLLAFRVAWGLAGSRYARFRSFLFGPAALRDYLVSLASGHPQRHAGHNPAGALAIFGLLALIGIACGTGFALWQDTGPGWLEEIHEGAAVALLALAGVHVAGVVASSLLHRENLVRSMLSGWKTGQPHEGMAGMHTAVGLLLLAALVAFWAMW